MWTALADSESPLKCLPHLQQAADSDVWCQEASYAQTVSQSYIDVPVLPRNFQLVNRLQHHSAENIDLSTWLITPDLANNKYYSSTVQWSNTTATGTDKCLFLRRMCGHYCEQKVKYAATTSNRMTNETSIDLRFSFRSVLSSLPTTYTNI